MHRSAVPAHAVSQLADVLGVSEASLHALMPQSGARSADPTLVGLTVAEAARRIGIGRTKMYEYIASGEIPSAKIGRLRRVPAEAVNEFLLGRLGRDDFGAAV
ncbi:helix-turn-helix domain-containing protein [Streptomyces niveus]|uniref:helix-turn-helix domain-containing protein n=1 Tax=Streptomyces niveus TaxID=193462 RepID=UPI00367889EB